MPPLDHSSSYRIRSLSYESVVPHARVKDDLQLCPTTRSLDIMPMLKTSRSFDKVEKESCPDSCSQITACLAVPRVPANNTLSPAIRAIRSLNEQRIDDMQLCGVLLQNVPISEFEPHRVSI